MVFKYTFRSSLVHFILVSSIVSMQDWFWKGSKATTWCIPYGLHTEDAWIWYSTTLQAGQPVALLKVVKSTSGILTHHPGRGSTSATVKFLDSNGWALASQLVVQWRAVRCANAAQQR